MAAEQDTGRSGQRVGEIAGTGKNRLIKAPLCDIF
jgi:hypothetical protein